jgi:hypothetical protein
MARNTQATLGVDMLVYKDKQDNVQDTPLY